jgi:hypothetical protein
MFRNTNVQQQPERTGYDSAQIYLKGHVITRSAEDMPHPFLTVLEACMRQQCIL